MPIPGSDDPSHTKAPAISAHGRVVTGIGFLPDHNVTIRINCRGEDVSDFLAYSADREGHLYAELPTSEIGTLYITATDHRIDPAGDCNTLWSNTYTVVVGDAEA
jgi:hypothetical protein